MDYIEFIQLKNILDDDSMIKRRLFLSSCNVCNNTLVASLQKSGFLSIVGPVENIGLPDAAIFWASFYHYMFKENDRIASDEKDFRILNIKISAFIKIKGSPRDFKKTRAEHKQKKALQK